MTILILIIAVFCLSGIAFGTGAMRALARVILIGGGLAAAAIAGVIVLALMGHPI